MRQNWNARQGRRDYHLKLIWYSSKVYKENEKVLSIKYSPNSLGSIDLQKPKLPDNYEISDKEQTINGKLVKKGQIIELIYYKEKATDKIYSIAKKPLFKKSRYDGTDVPMMRNDFYDDSAMVDPENEQKFPEPSGIIYCKNSGPITNGTQDLHNMVHFNNKEIRLETRDYVYDMKKDDKVWFRNMWWRVDDVQTSEITRSKQYLSKPDTETYITLVR